MADDDCHDIARDNASSSRGGRGGEGSTNIIRTPPADAMDDERSNIAANCGGGLRICAREDDDGGDGHHNGHSQSPAPCLKLYKFKVHGGGYPLLVLQGLFKFYLDLIILYYHFIHKLLLLC